MKTFLTFGGAFFNTNSNFCCTLFRAAMLWSPPFSQLDCHGSIYTESIPVRTKAVQLFRLVICVLALTATSSAQTTASVQIFPQFANGAGVTSEVVLVNLSSSTVVQGTIEAFGDDGAPWSIIPTNAAFRIEPDGSYSMKTSGVGPLTSGWLRIRSTSPVIGVIKFYLPGLGTAAVQGVSGGYGFYVMPVKRTAAFDVNCFCELISLNTGVAIVNLDTQAAQTFALYLYDTQGKPVTTFPGYSTIARNGHRAAFIDELIPRSSWEAHFEGVLVLEPQPGLSAGMAVMGLEIGNAPGQFTTLPVGKQP